MPITRKKIKIFTAMSGGVDSSVAALLLKQKGYDVVGVYIKGWSLTDCAQKDSEDARRVAGILNIPFYVFDFEDQYKKSVVDYMIRSYASGITPNPDVMCNKEIKFGLFLEKALALGADFIATGHYVRLSANNESNTNKRITNSLIRNKIRYSLMRAKDLNKDQSYFLWTLTQKQLRHCLFPIGNYTKQQVRVIAGKRCLPTAEKPDSQGVCFIGEIDVAKFLKEKLGKNPGPIKTIDNKTIGTHDGAIFYTIGQRKGIGSTGGGVPYYVASKNIAENTLIVAEAEDWALFSKETTVKDVNWISGKAPKLPVNCLARIRYRQPLQNCTINLSNHQLKVLFNTSQRAITSGQSAVFYIKSGEMLGGGIIE